jgi:ABC-type lipoprotein release transport system permease subunit
VSQRHRDRQRVRSHGQGQAIFAATAARATVWQIGTGLVLGVILSLAVTGVARTLLFGLDPRDASTMTAAVAALTLVALMASLIPAQRAARVDPMSTLKDE